MSKKLDNELIMLKGKFEESEVNQRDSRVLSNRDRDYYDDKQTSSERQEAYKRRNQPCVTMNRIKNKMDFMFGLERSSRNDPQALARTPVHEADAAAVTDILRYLETKNEFDDTRSSAFKNFAIEGTAAAKIEIHALTDNKGNTKDFDIELRHIQWDRIFWDPHSRREDFRDAMFKGEVIFVDEDVAKSMFPGKDKIIESAFLQEATDIGAIFEDKPNILWADKTRKRVRIVEIWYRKGKEIWHAIFTSGGFIEKPARTPYRDDNGQDEDPYIFRSAFVDREGNRYGYVRPMISPQDEINMRRSKAMHLMSVRQLRISRNSELDTSKVRKELARPDGIIRAEADELEILPTGDMAQAQFELLRDAQTQIDQIGMNSSLQGKFAEAASGKALQARAATGAIEINPLFDGIRMWQRQVFKKAWNRVREYWTEEKYVRVTDDLESPKYMLINRAETKKEFAGDERPEEADNVIEIKTPIPELDVDIIIKEGANDVLAQQEQFIELTRMAASGVQIPLDILIELSSLRPSLKQKVLERLRVPPEVQEQQAQMQQQDALLTLAKKQADVEDTTASAAKKRAEAENAQIGAIIKQVKPLEEL